MTILIEVNYCKYAHDHDKGNELASSFNRVWFCGCNLEVIKLNGIGSHIAS